VTYTYALLFALFGVAMSSPSTGQTPASTTLPLQALVQSYPDLLDRIEGNELVWMDGTRMIIDDGKGPKDLETRLNAPDIKDMFDEPYPSGRTGTPPSFESDPGRVRFQPLFDKMYGNCLAGEVEARLVEVDWMPGTGASQKLKVNKGNGIEKKLAAVVDELTLLPQEFVKFLKPSAGTFNCRPIEGTTRISAHGHAIAIDINVDYSDYWRWTQPDASGRYPYKNRIPWEIVEIFEKHGFIWGGKWYHYDTMHFEYRPELLVARKAQASEPVAPARQ
jgi:D-alanyl-D-alanine carboxypeptidase